MGAMQPWHWIVLIIVVVILFGSKKLPDAARGLGRSLRIFKSEVGEMKSDGSSTTAAAEPKDVAPKELPSSEPKAVEQAREAADKPADK